MKWRREAMQLLDKLQQQHESEFILKLAQNVDSLNYVKADELADFRERAKPVYATFHQAGRFLPG